MSLPFVALDGRLLDFYDPYMRDLWLASPLKTVGNVSRTLEREEASH